MKYESAFQNVFYFLAFPGSLDKCMNFHRHIYVSFDASALAFKKKTRAFLKLIQAFFFPSIYLTTITAIWSLYGRKGKRFFLQMSVLNFTLS